MTSGSRVGAYQIVKPIGAGGMGEVWLAEHTMLGRRAAIKFLNPSFTHRPEIVTRFFNEARAATAIADPGIVQIFDFGHREDGSAYIVMELLDGETLDARCRRYGGALPVGDALRLLRQVASSLGAAHARGIVHRDLKPENIFLVRDPEVPGGERAKILDFGIAKLTGADDAGFKTQTSALMGTPSFMSPEQCRGAGAVDQRSDVYSLGCVLFAVVTGRVPFVAEGAGELIAMHLREEAPRAHSVAPHVPPAVDDLIARCLAKDPAARFASGTALSAALGALLSVPSMPAGTEPGLRGAAPTTLSGSAIALAAPAPRGARRPIAIAVLVAGLAAAAIVMWRVVPSATDQPDGSEVVKLSTIPAPAIDAAVAVSVSVPIDSAPVDERPARARAGMRRALAAIRAWSASPHRSCATAADLALEPDPWGTALRVTCDDQPEDQIAGVTSAGPDRSFGTADDVRSWIDEPTLAAAITGTRWKPAKRTVTAPPATRPPAVAAPPQPPATVTPPQQPPPSSSPAVDANGIPIKR